MTSIWKEIYERPLFPRALLGMGALVLFVLGLWFLLPAGYEQAPAPKGPGIKVEEAALWMDQRPRHLWSHLGVSPSELRSMSLRPRNWEGKRWEMRFFEVGIPPELPMTWLTDGPEGLVEETAHGVHVVWIEEEKELWAADIWVDRFLTRRVLFRANPEGPRKAAPNKRRPQIALIVDDLGNTYTSARSLLDMGFPLTLSVFPKRPYSQRIASEGLSMGFEVMLHLPMEPWEYPDKDPGVGAMLLSMDTPELERILWENFKDLPEVQGVNNHMGSRFTESLECMRAVLEVLTDRGLYFVDSLTSPRSVGYDLAKQMGMRAYKRDLFLDSIDNEARIRAQFHKLLQVASVKGYAIGICHPRRETVEVLPQLCALAVDQGYELVTVSQLRIPEG